MKSNFKISGFPSFRPWFVAALLVILGLLPSSANGQYAGAFARTGFGARGISLGNALAGDASGDSSPYYNPAFAPLSKRQHIEASVAALSFDRSLQFLQLSAPLQTKAGFSLGIIHAAVSNIDGRDNSGFHTRDLSVDEYAGFLAFGLRFSNKLSAGISLQMFRTDLFEGLTPARSVGLDVGFAYQMNPKWSVGLVADDLLARYSWDSSDLGESGRNITDSFPRRIRMGVSTSQLEGRLRVHSEVESRFSSVRILTRETRLFGNSPAETTDEEVLTHQEFRVRVGSEFVPLPGFSVRAGIEQLGSEVADSVRPSVGFMIEQPVGSLNLRLEYGYARESTAGGNMHLASLTLFL